MFPRKIVSGKVFLTSSQQLLAMPQLTEKEDGLCSIFEKFQLIKLTNFHFIFFLPVCVCLWVFRFRGFFPRCYPKNILGCFFSSFLNSEIYRIFNLCRTDRIACFSNLLFWNWKIVDMNSHHEPIESKCLWWVLSCSDQCLLAVSVEQSEGLTSLTARSVIESIWKTEGDKLKLYL